MASNTLSGPIFAFSARYDAKVANNFKAKGFKATQSLQIKGLKATQSLHRTKKKGFRVSQSLHRFKKDSLGAKKL
jgi:hypothetical protein